MRLGFSLLTALALVATATQAVAADVAIRERTRATARAPGVTVVVDELFLRSGGCPRNPNCIAPRILPVVGNFQARAVALTPITVPVDPRFAHQY